MTMENVESLKNERRRRFRFMLPVLVLPFVTLMFWVLGGGKVEQAQAADAGKVKGLNNVLPDASLKEEQGDKMSYYDKANMDSANRQAMIKSDPYYQAPVQQITSNGSLPYQQGYPISNMPQPFAGGGYNDPNEARVYQKLQQLNQSLIQCPQMPVTGPVNAGMGVGAPAPDLSKLERMMEQMQSGSEEPDAETEQLNGMLERILDIQHPERVQEKLRKNSEMHKGQVFGVSSAKKREIISILEENKVAGVVPKDGGNGFYAFDQVEENTPDQNVVAAVVHETQVIVNGSTVKLRLLDDIYINGKLIPKDKFVYGIASLSGERLTIKIPGIQYKKLQFPVDLTVIDIDGLEGIHVPGAIARDVAKESTDRAIQDVQFGSMSDNLGVQAASAGVEAAKTLFSKKVRLIKVTVKAGYKVMLRDEKQR